MAAANLHLRIGNQFRHILEQEGWIGKRPQIVSASSRETFPTPSLHGGGGNGGPNGRFLLILAFSCLLVVSVSALAMNNF